MSVGRWKTVVGRDFLNCTVPKILREVYEDFIIGLYFNRRNYNDKTKVKLFAFFRILNVTYRKYMSLQKNCLSIKFRNFICCGSLT